MIHDVGVTPVCEHVCEHAMCTEACKRCGDAMGGTYHNGGGRQLSTGGSAALCRCTQHAKPAGCRGLAVLSLSFRGMSCTGSLPYKGRRQQADTRPIVACVRLL